MTSNGTSGHVQSSPDIGGDRAGGDGNRTRHKAGFHLTFKGLAIFLVVLMTLVGIGIAWYWQYACTPEGRARNILAELRGNRGGFRGWLIAKGAIKKSPPVPGPPWEAAWAKLIQIGPEALPTLAEALKEPDAEVRKNAANACGALGDPKAAPALLEALKDPDVDVRCSVIAALTKCWGKDALPTLAGMLKDEAVYVRFDAAEWIGTLEDNRAIEPLTACMDDANEDDDVRVIAGGGLARLHEQKGFDFLRAQLQDKSKVRRFCAAGELAKSGDKRALAPLIAAANDEDSHVRMCAAEALGTLGDKQAIPTLRTMLQDKDPDGNVYQAAALALVTLGDKQAIPALRRMLKEPNRTVRERAAEALKKLGVNEDFTKQVDPP